MIAEFVELLLPEAEWLMRSEHSMERDRRIQEQLSAYQSRWHSMGAARVPGQLFHRVRGGGNNASSGVPSLGMPRNKERQRSFEAMSASELRKAAAAERRERRRAAERRGESAAFLLRGDRHITCLCSSPNLSIAATAAPKEPASEPA